MCEVWQGALSCVKEATAVWEYHEVVYLVRNNV